MSVDKKKRSKGGVGTGERILEGAGELFSKHGFRGVGIDDIGATAGVTGPALYRYFESKESLLSAIFEKVLNELVTKALMAREGTNDPREALRRLTDVEIELALEKPHLIRLYVNEEHNLPTVARRRVRERQALYIRQWAETLLAIRPELSEESAETLAFAVQWAVCSLGYRRSRVPKEELRGLMRSLVMSALLLEEVED